MRRPRKPSCRTLLAQEKLDSVNDDGHRVSEDVENAFGSEIDYAMLVKIYGASATIQNRVTAPQPASVAAPEY